MSGESRNRGDEEVDKFVDAGGTCEGKCRGIDSLVKEILICLEERDNSWIPFLVTNDFIPFLIENCVFFEHKNLFIFRTKLSLLFRSLSFDKTYLFIIGKHKSTL